MLNDETFFAFARAAVQFANLPRIERADDVERLFVPWCQQLLPGADAPTTYRTEQNLLRATLEKFADQFSDPPEPRLLAELVGDDRYGLIYRAGAIGQAPVAVIPLEVARDGFVLALPAASMPGVKGTWLFVVSELIGPRRGKQHIVQCNFAGCDNFIFRELLGGRPRPYCSDEHSDKAGRDGSLRKREITRKTER